MEKDDEYHPERDNLSLGHARADALLKKYGSIENTPEYKKKKAKEDKELKKESELEKRALFVNSSDQQRLNPDRVFDNRDAKQSLMNYHEYFKLYNGQLYGRDGPGDFLSKLNDSTVGNAFKRLYYSSKKQLGK